VLLTKLLRYLFVLFFLKIGSVLAQPQVLTEKQLGNQRVWNARLSCDDKLKNLFQAQLLQYPPRFVYWRAFKKEKEMELWAADSAHHRYRLIKTYKIVNTSGNLGPKRQEGDFQIPEGYYHINQYNPYSNFYLSFKVSYPNKSDSILGKKGNYGGQIFVHGDSLTIGCLPMSNEVIKELYWCNIQVNSNQNDTNYNIPIHIYPCRMNSSNWAYLKSMYNFDPSRIEFWQNLQSGYNYFELMRKPPAILVDNKGRYLVRY
jgi:murein L,D-transpeptidase YafK